MAELDEVVKQFDDMQEMNLRLMQQLRDLEDCNTQLGQLTGGTCWCRVANVMRQLLTGHG